MNARDVILRPVVSEKSYAALDANVYTFEVAPGANKIQIKHAVEEIFGVTRHQREHAEPRGQAQAQPPHRHLGPPRRPEAGDRLARRRRPIEIFGS